LFISYLNFKIPLLFFPVDYLRLLAILNPVGVTLKPHCRYLQCGFSLSSYHHRTTDFI